MPLLLTRDLPYLPRTNLFACAHPVKLRVRPQTVGGALDRIPQLMHELHTKGAASKGSAAPSYRIQFLRREPQTVGSLTHVGTAFAPRAVISVL